jgi:hypothetical protein
MMKRVFSIAFAAALCLFAQSPHYTTIHPAAYDRELPFDQGSAALWQSLKKLHTRASLIMITAHPDDEDGGMLAYESRGRGTRVALLTLNRGEGARTSCPTTTSTRSAWCAPWNSSARGGITAWISIGRG